MILMDEPRPVRFRRFTRTSHLSSDLPGEEGTAEIDAFAKRIGLKVAWRQSSGTATEHYDLFDGACDRAIAAGAQVVSGRELVERVVQPKRRDALEGPDRDIAARPDCTACNGTGRVPYESDDFPPGTNGCWCTSRRWRLRNPHRHPEEG